ncbi:MAG TPA: Crp/Fnr family transcriptional regulator [Chitinophagaceae bacterium]|nr:Crp/Fnr family transcriptional regulator [Chitinophagaceae bacterium]
MGSLFFKDFEPSIRLWNIKEKPFEHGQQFIREIFLHMQITDEKKISEAIAHFKPNIYKKGDHFFSEGETCDKIGFIIKGGVEIYMEENGRQQILFFLTEEDFFTDLKSFLHQKPSRLNIEFIETSIVLEVDHIDFRNFIAVNPEFGTVFMRVMSYVTAAVTNMNMTLKLPGRTRYEKLLELQPQLFNRFLLQDIASFLGVKQETLSRIRNQLKNETNHK